MKNATKENILLEHLHKNGAVDLNDASRILGVSESTTRRVFNTLQSSGIAFRTHGGIRLAEASVYSFAQLVGVHPEEKQAIGKLACAQIQSGDVLYLDCGTTMLFLCRQLAAEITAGRLADIKVLTNSIANLEVLAPCAPVVLLGGAYRPQRRDFAGFLTKGMLEGLHFDRCFLGTDGIGLPFSAGAMDFDTADLNCQVVGRSREVVVLSDSSKFARPALVAYARADQVDCLITDDRLDPAIHAACAAEGLRVLCAVC
ncbi:DeoR/GlpR family DNA-binding transcription regulator [Ruminococcaceae bacterium OttesenSCG-928-A11]|nr:DeoR/GlpR family DNA-binding transcription regulator [Ruminococcaceae bacterium OttesenSCG-928-A11]